MDDLTAYATALGVSAAAGLNAWIPLLMVGLLARFTGILELPDGWEALQETWALGILAVVGAADFVGDKIPAVDSVLHAAGVVIAPVAGVVASIAASGGDGSPVVLALIGIVTAEFAHGTRALLRPISTVSTAGTANVGVSATEDFGSFALSLGALVAPIIAAIAVLTGMVGVAIGGRSLWRRRRRRRAPA